MASVLKLLPLFFLLTIILSSAHKTQARDSQFFSKVSRENPDNIYTDNNENSNNVVQDTKLPNDVKDVDVSKSHEEPEPAFLPQTNQHGYGLYGHETTGLYGHETTQKFPPSTATTQRPYTTTDTKTPYTTTTKTAEYEQPTSYGNKDNKAYNVNNNNNYAYSYDLDNNKEQGMKTGEDLQQQRSGYFYTSNEGENNKKKNNYAEELHGLDETTLAGSGYATAGEHQNGVFNNKNYGYNNGVEKTGMSDTRYLENGRYFHDINSEKMNQPKNYNTNGDEQYNTNDRYNGYYYGKNNGDDKLNGYNYDHQFNGINTNSRDQGYENMAYQYKSNQGNNMAYRYNNNNQGNTMAYGGRYNNNNMGYQYKANNYNNQDQDDFEFDP